MLRRNKKAKDAVKDDASAADSGGSFGELISTILWALGIALILRTFIFQPFTIPSGSMYPNLEVGDYIITSKYSVGYGKFAAAPLPFPEVEGRLFGRGPERGDVIVFRPKGSDQNYIKRVVGLPGDQIQVIDGVLHINGVPNRQDYLGQATYSHREGREVVAEFTVEKYNEYLPGDDEPHIIYDARKNSKEDNTGVFTVPSGQYFMMGDNRDFSADSRVPVRLMGAGYIPAEHIVGKAEFILISVSRDFYIFKPWTWGNINTGRLFKRIE